MIEYTKETPSVLVSFRRRGDRRPGLQGYDRKNRMRFKTLLLGTRVGVEMLHVDSGLLFFGEADTQDHIYAYKTAVDRLQSSKEA